MILEDKCSFHSGVEIQKKNKEKINRTVERTMTTGGVGPTEQKGQRQGREGTNSFWVKPSFAIGFFFFFCVLVVTELKPLLSSTTSSTYKVVTTEV